MPYQTPPNHDPTPDEIAAACAAIRSEWDEDERRRRAALELRGLGRDGIKVCRSHIDLQPDRGIFD